MSDDEPAVPVACPECETTTRIPLSDLKAGIEAHNDRLHDGEEVARIDPAIKEELTDLVAKDLELLD
ncbi:hypothetical protein [Halovenus marina]|uniref:hypothetical protein n=1 Tax=Halovenus marina TaxID=3396621 RepID=UPI003F565867